MLYFSSLCFIYSINIGLQVTESYVSWIKSVFILDSFLSSLNLVPKIDLC